jgi:hypothetical protein
MRCQCSHLSRARGAAVPAAAVRVPGVPLSLLPLYACQGCGCPCCRCTHVFRALVSVLAACCCIRVFGLLLQHWQPAAVRHVCYGHLPALRNCLTVGVVSTCALRITVRCRLNRQPACTLCERPALHTLAAARWLGRLWRATLVRLWGATLARLWGATLVRAWVSGAYAWAVLSQLLRSCVQSRLRWPFGPPLACPATLEAGLLPSPSLESAARFLTAACARAQVHFFGSYATGFCAGARTHAVARLSIDSLQPLQTSQLLVATRNR